MEGAAGVGGGGFRGWDRCRRGRRMSFRRMIRVSRRCSSLGTYFSLSLLQHHIPVLLPRSIANTQPNSVEDDLAEHHIRTFFTAFGPLKSIVCVHRSRCAFVNFQTRSGAEAAAVSCQGKAVIAGCPLRVQWGRTRPLGNMDRSQAGGRGGGGGGAVVEAQGVEQQEAQEGEGDRAVEDLEGTLVMPPGSEDRVYPSQVAG